MCILLRSNFAITWFKGNVSYTTTSHNKTFFFTECNRYPVPVKILHLGINPDPICIPAINEEACDLSISVHINVTEEIGVGKLEVNILRFAKCVRLSSGRMVEVLTLYTQEGVIYLLQRGSSPLLSVEQFVY